MNPLKFSLFILLALLSILASAKTIPNIPLGDQAPVLYLDFSKENWLRVGNNYVVRDQAGHHQFSGEFYLTQYRPVVCKKNPGKFVLQTLSSAVTQMPDSNPNDIPLQQGEDFTIAGWFRFDPDIEDGQMIFSQRKDIDGDSFGPEVSWNLNFDGNKSGNAYYFIMNRQQLSNPVDLYSASYAEANWERSFRYNAYQEYHDYLESLWTAQTFMKPQQQRSAGLDSHKKKIPYPMKPVPPGLPPELPTTNPNSPPEQQPVNQPIAIEIPYPGPNVFNPPPIPPDRYPPPPPIPRIPPAPLSGPPPYSAKDHVYMNYGFGGDSGATCLSHDSSGEVRRQCWHFVAITYTFQDPRGPHAEIYFYRVNPFTQLIESDPVRHIPREGLEASRPINTRNNFFRLGGHSSAVFKDVAVYKKALRPDQVYGFVKQTAPVGPSYSCDYSDLRAADLDL